MSLSGNSLPPFRPHRSLLGAFYRIMDAACLVASLFIISLLSPYPWYDPTWQHLYLFAAACAVGLFFLVAEYHGLYVAARGASIWHELAQLVWIWFAVLLGLLLIAYATKMSAAFPRRVMFAWFVIGPLVVMLWRVCFGALLRVLRNRGFGEQTVAVFGVGELGQRVAQTIQHTPSTGMRLFGFFDEKNVSPVPSGGQQSPEIKGCPDELVRLAHEGAIDAVYIALPMSRETTVEALVSRLADTNIAVYVIPNVFMFELLHARWMTFEGVPIISVFESPFYGVDGSIKRGVDIVLSLAILAFICVPMLIIAIAVKRSSPGAVIYKQRRYGLDGREIVVWKFRTMTVCDNGATAKQAVKDDPRVTPIGHFLRRNSLDELPQFINVLQGRMSIVGPRPHPVSLNEQHRHLIRGYMLRHRVKPGITGLAQINGWRGETETLEKMQKRIEYDLAYIRHWTLWMDFSIILKTIISGFRNENAY